MFDLLDYERHESANQLQVIMGYLSLDKKEALGAYLTELVSFTKDQATLAKLPRHRFTLELLLAPLVVTKSRISVKITERFLLSPEQADQALRIWQLLRNFIENSSVNYTRILLLISQHNSALGIKFEFKIDEPSETINISETEELRNNLRTYNLSVLLLNDLTGFIIT